MSATEPQQEAIEKAWKLLGLPADTMPKLGQAQAEPWKGAIGGRAAGGALVAGTAAPIKLFAP